MCGHPRRRHVPITISDDNDVIDTFLIPSYHTRPYTRRYGRSTVNMASDNAWNLPSNTQCSCCRGMLLDCVAGGPKNYSYAADLHAVLFCDDTSRYGVPENLTTG